MEEALSELIAAISSYETTGILVAFVGAIYAITRATKLPQFAALLGEKRRGWRPWIAAGLGFAGGFAAALAAQTGIVPAIAAGLSAAVLGFSATGADQIVTNATKTGQQRAEVAAGTLAIVDAPPSEVGAKVAAAHDALDRASSLPPGPARLEALAKGAPTP